MRVATRRIVTDDLLFLYYYYVTLHAIAGILERARILANDNCINKGGLEMVLAILMKQSNFPSLSRKLHELLPAYSSLQ